MTDSPPKRRWYQFSLRTLIVVVLVSCVAFGGWLQFRRDRAAKNRQRVAAVQKAVDEIEKLGGIVQSVYEKRRPATLLEELFDDPGGPDDPVGVLNVLYVTYFNVTDVGLKHVKGLTNLKFLNLTNTKVSDAELKHLKGLTSLQNLFLCSTNVTDQGVERLREALPNCEIIRDW